MREVTLKIYKYDELSDDAKAKARDWYNSCWDSNDEELVKEQLADKLESIGFPTDDLRYSFSNSQGDGVAFYGEVDVVKFAEKNNCKEKYANLFNNDEPIVTINIKKSRAFHHYDHHNTMYVEVEDLYAIEEEIFGIAEDLEEHILLQAQLISKDLHNLGYKIIEDMQSEENVAENIRCNEYEFTEDGTRY